VVLSIIITRPIQTYF